MPPDRTHWPIPRWAWADQGADPVADRRPVHILLNPASGGGRALARWRRSEAACRAALGPLEVYHSRHRGDLANRASELANLPVTVIAAGGDGTSHEVVTGLLRPPRDRPPQAVLGWLPLGSGNDLAHAAGVPRGTAAAARMLAAATARPIDIGFLKCRDGAGTVLTCPFGNSATFGLSAAVLEFVARHGKPLGGPLSYALAAVAVLLRKPPVEFTLSPDGSPTAPGRYLLVSCTSGPTFGARMRIAPGARIDDGALDLVTVAAMPRARALRLFPRVYRGTHLRHPAVARRPLHHLVIAPVDPGPISFELDGELHHGYPPLALTVCPGALRALVRG